MSSVRDFQKRYVGIAKRRGFDQAELRDYMLLLVEEVGELCRAVTTHEGVFRLNPGEGNMAEELADIFNYCLYISHVLGIDLQDAIISKMDRLDK